MNRYDFVTVGNYTKDTIVSAAGTRHVDGGGYNYAAHAARLLGLSVAAVTRRAAADAHIAEPLTAAGIDVFAFDSPGSTLMRLEYPTANVDERVLSVKGVADPIGPEHFDGLEAHTFLVTASIRGEVALATVKAMKARCQRLALDVQGFVRVVTPEGRLAIEAKPNQDTPLMDGKRVLMGNDVWEHAYYLNYQNRRADYLKAWWNVVNWRKVGERYAAAKAGKLAI